MSYDVILNWLVVDVNSEPQAKTKDREMDTDNSPGFGLPDPLDAAALGQSPFARRRQTVLGKLALGLSLVPWAAFGLMCILQPG